MKHEMNISAIKRPLLQCNVLQNQQSQIAFCGTSGLYSLGAERKKGRHAANGPGPGIKPGSAALTTVAFTNGVPALPLNHGMPEKAVLLIYWSIDVPTVSSGYRIWNEKYGLLCIGSSQVRLFMNLIRMHSCLTQRINSTQNVLK
ncbi:hypothetical protein AMECASPLE_029239 [Ameca splendens]|uniref:Uncharacterized protein n=1 Tax=Ameca splendens TaxID=208324 RepID=A0ABV0Z3W8_9TELE